MGGFAGAQLSIFDSAPEYLARRSDPSTSHKAAARVAEFSGKHKEIVLACLKKYGPLSKDGIAKRTQLTAVQVDRRLPDLERAGLAMPTGIERMSASGRPEREWRAI